MSNAERQQNFSIRSAFSSLTRSEAREWEQQCSQLLAEVQSAFAAVPGYERGKGTRDMSTYTREQHIPIDEITNIGLVATLPNEYTYTEYGYSFLLNRDWEKTHHVRHSGPSTYELQYTFVDDGLNEHYEKYTFTVSTTRLGKTHTVLSGTEMIIPRVLVDGVHEGTALFLPNFDPIDQAEMPERIRNALRCIPDTVV